MRGESTSMNSWLDLEQRFRALSLSLQHCRLDGQWGAAGEYWRIAGAPMSPAAHEFEVLSGMAGRLLESVYRSADELEKALLAIPDPEVRWFNLLKAKSPLFGDHSYGQQINEDGSSAGFIFTGTLRQPAEASALLCLSLHATHPLLYKKSKWRTSFENYGKPILIGTILLVVGALIKLFGA
jgi:hypothetical protein